MWLEPVDYARMKVWGDAEQSVEHLLNVVRGIYVSDLVVQRATAKSQASQGHFECAMRLIENRCCVSSVLRQPVWLVSRCGLRGATLI